MAHIVVLGGGLVGRAMGLTLARDPDLRVTLADRDPQRLKQLGTGAISSSCVDLADTGSVAAAVSQADVVVGAVPGHLGFQVLRQVIEAGKPYVDIAFMPENALELDELARQRGVTAVVDCGLAPGISNLLCGRAAQIFDRLDRVLILVGGLPQRRVWPFEYRAVFSPVDVIEEYTRPARLVEHGELVVRPALSEVEPVDLPRVGTLEAFNTDGLRSLATTIPAPFMKEKTLRYPGHAERMRMLRETGFFGAEPVRFGGQEVRPIDLTSALLFRAWQMPEGEGDLTVMRVEVEGTVQGAPRTYTWDLYDEHDPRSGLTSMARTTGFPCVAVARMLARGELHKPGVHPPETLGRDLRLSDAILAELERYGLELRLTVL